LSEQLAENEKSLLVIRTPLSGECSVSIYFSSQDGRPMNLSEWSRLKQLIELVSKMCITQEEKIREAAA
jgi:hypothetical protein